MNVKCVAWAEALLTEPWKGSSEITWLRRWHCTEHYLHQDIGEKILFTCAMRTCSTALGAMTMSLVARVDATHPTRWTGWSNCLGLAMGCDSTAVWGLVVNKGTLRVNCSAGEWPLPFVHSNEPERAIICLVHSSPLLIQTNINFIEWKWSGVDVDKLMSSLFCGTGDLAVLKA